jgi:ribosomal protein S18 acetylase RimI-like enzyme
MNIHIRPIQHHELAETVEIYLASIRDDYSFKPPEYLDALTMAEELNECEEWLYQEGVRNRIYAAFDGELMVGYIALGTNTLEPFEYEGEVTGFFIRKEYRAQGIGLMLLRRGLQYFQELGYTGLVIYNYHISAANAYYRSLGGVVVKQEIQHPGGMELETDIFGYKIDNLMKTVDQKLEKYAPSNLPPV